MRQLPHSHSRLLSSILILGALAAVPSRLSAADEPSLDLSRLVQGTWDGIAGPGNQLFIRVQPKSSSAYTFTFDVTIQGRYDERNISIHGVLTVDREGEAARLSWTNGKSACDFPVRRSGDGFQGSMLRDSCLTAFQVPVRGTWSVQVEGASLLLVNGESGETLRFRKHVEGEPKGQRESPRG